MSTLFAEALHLLETGQSFALSTVLSHKGSTPRSAGSKMITLPDRIVGTIGGGGVEGEVVSIARSQVLGDGGSVVKTYDLTKRDSSAGSFVCGGIFEILTTRIDPSDEMLELWNTLRDAELSPQSTWLFILIPDDISEESAYLCANVKGNLIGNVPNNKKLRDLMTQTPESVSLQSEDLGYRVFAESIRSLDTLYVFGGGHVALETARIAVGLEFRVIILDDREEFANEARFPNCETIVLESFGAIPELPTTDSYILIVTRGHIHDEEVLEWALNQDSYYLGMMGSRTKRDTIYKQLIAKGATSDQLTKVHCPIGIDIGAETPQELAVSIVAELISVQKEIS